MKEDKDIIEKHEKENLYIVIPAYNEEENIDKVATEWYEVVEKIGENSKLVIINDGSKDGTLDKLRGLEKQFTNLIVLDKENGGHGDTVLYGYKYALDNGASYIFQTDSDGQTLPEEFWEFWNRRKEYNAIIGYRKNREDGISRIIVTKTLKLVLFLIFRLNVTDANTPFRLMDRNILQKYYSMIPEHFNLPNVMLTVLLLDNKEKVEFRKITFRPRQGGVNSINLKKITKIGIQAVKDFMTIKRNLKAKGKTNEGYVKN